MSRLIACQSKRTTSISLTMAPCSAYQCNGPHITPILEAAVPTEGTPEQLVSA